MEREIKENAICLKSEDSGDYDRILTLLSIDRGLIKAKIKGVKKPKAKLSFCSFPFAFGEYMFVKVGNSNSVINCNHIDSFFELTYDLNKFYAGSSLLELTRLVAKENQACTGLFVSLLKSLQNLCYTNINIFSIMSKYLLDCLEFCGLTVSISVGLNINEPVSFNLENGEITNIQTQETIKMQESDVSSVIELLSGGVDIVTEKTKTSKNLLKLLLIYFENKTEERLEVLRQFIK